MRNKNRKSGLKGKLALLFLMMVFVTSVLFGCADTADQNQSSTATESVSETDPDTAEADDNVNDADQADIEDNIDDLESDDTEDSEYIVYTFRNQKLLDSHYEKHGIDMGFDSAEDYEEAASDVVNNPNALHKTEEEDGDDIYYVEDTNEFVVVSTDGYIRTYFLPDAGKRYYDKQ